MYFDMDNMAESRAMYEHVVMFSSSSASSVALTPDQSVAATVPLLLDEPNNAAYDPLTCVSYRRDDVNARNNRTPALLNSYHPLPHDASSRQAYQWSCEPALICDKVSPPNSPTFSSSMSEYDAIDGDVAHPKTYDTSGQLARTCAGHYRRSSCRVLGLILFLITYMVLGALVFIGLEEPQEIELRKELRSVRIEFAKRVNTCSTGRFHFVYMIFFPCKDNLHKS